MSKEILLFEENEIGYLDILDNQLLYNEILYCNILKK